MSAPPPDDLKDWSKNNLIRELRRLRALLREHSERQHGEARRAGTHPPMMDFGTPHSRGGVILDARGAVLMDALDVCLLDTKGGGEESGEELVVLALTLAGRINFSRERSETMYLFDADGAAAIVSQLVGLAVRVGPEFATALMERLEALPSREEAGDV